MTPNKIIEAYKAIHELTDVVLPFKAARELSALKKRLEEEFGTIVNQEHAIATKYGGVKQSNGTYNFPSGAFEGFSAEFSEFRAQDDESISLPRVDLSKYTGALRISAGALEALDGIITFEQPEGKK